jgi:hypothetical protein
MIRKLRKSRTTRYWCALKHCMLTWHLLTNDPTVLFEKNGQTVLLQTRCLISKIWILLKNAELPFWNIKKEMKATNLDAKDGVIQRFLKLNRWRW